MDGILMNQVNVFVLCKQHLADDARSDDLVRIVKDIIGLHATSAIAPYLSLFARMQHFRKDDLKKELAVTRSLGKIRCVRGTLYILTKDMLPAVYVTTKKLVQPLSEDYLKYLGLTPEEYKEMASEVLGLLKGTGMTTQEIRKALRTKANLSPVINLMCDQGLLIRGVPKGGWRNNSHTYYLFEEYFPDVDLNGMDEREARTTVVRSYLASFGPATEKDIAWWTGLRKTDVRSALELMKEETCTKGIPELVGDFIMLLSDESKLKMTKGTQNRTVNLLPSLDPYIMGYKERERYLDRKHYEYVFDRSGNATSTILLDGRIIGVWDSAEYAKPLVKLFLFEKVEGDALKKIYLEAQRIGKFIADGEVRIKECSSMIPLTQRTAGGFMSPLKDC